MGHATRNNPGIAELDTKQRCISVKIHNYQEIYFEIEKLYFLRPDWALVLLTPPDLTSLL